MKHLLLITCLLWLGLAASPAQLTPATTRLALTGSVAPAGLSGLTLTRADSANLAVALFDPTGTALLDLDGLSDLTLELYASSEATTQLAEPITLTAGDLNPELTLNEWAAGTAAHATFELGPAQTNVALTTRTLTCWGVIYGTMTDGSRRTFGAGSVVLRNGNAGGTPPADALDPLYPTLAQLLAYTTQVTNHEARLDILEAGGGTPGSGTVVSVGISSPAGITVGGSPVTGSGTITLTLDSDLVAIAALGTTSYGRSLLTAGDTAALQALAGLGPEDDAEFASLTTGGLIATSSATLPSTTWAAGSTYSYGAGSAAAHRTALSLVPGTNVQAWDADLNLWAALTPGTLATQSGTFSGVSSGTNTGDQTNITGNAGTATALASAQPISITGDATWAVTFDGSTSVTGALTIAADAVSYAKMQNVSAASRLIGRGGAAGSGNPEEITLGTGLSMPGTALTLAGDLPSISALTTTSFGRGLLTLADAAALRTTAGLVIGTAVQAWDPDLDLWATFTPATGIGTWLATPSSANLAAALTNETGSGLVVFGTTPTLTTPVISGAISLPDDVTQTFNPGTTNAGLDVGSLAGDPTTPGNGQLWYDSAANELTARINGANVALGAGGGGGSPGGSDTYLQYNNSGALGGNAGLVVNKTSGAVTQAQTTDAATNTQGLTLSTSATATSGNQKWSPFVRQRASGYGTTGAAAQTVDFEFGVKPTQGTAPTGAWALQTSINGAAAADVLTVDAAGVFVPFNKLVGYTASNAWQFGSGSATLFSGHATNSVLYVNGGTRLGVPSAGTFTWSSSAIASATADLTLLRKAAANLQQGAADAAAPVAQTSSVQSVVAGTTNTAGQPRTYSASVGTGTGASGAHVFTVAPAGSSGSAQNALVTALRIDPDKSLFIGDSTAAPATPTAGGVIYVEAGSLKYKGSSGTVTTLGAP